MLIEMKGKSEIVLAISFVVLRLATNFSMGEENKATFLWGHQNWHLY